MVESLAELHATLTAHRQSLTMPRKAVFAALQSHESLTMHELVALCEDRIDRASVYRTIQLFERIGIVQHVQIGWKYRLELSDAFRHHHHHMHCIQCGRTIALPADSALESRLHSLATQQGFRPQDHQIEIRGICSQCQST